MDLSILEIRTGFTANFYLGSTTLRGFGNLAWSEDRIILESTGSQKARLFLLGELFEFRKEVVKLPVPVQVPRDKC